MRVGAQTRNAKDGCKIRTDGNVKRCGSDPTTLLTRSAEELRRVGQKYEGAEVIVRW
jgi:hypothetical protein